MVDELAGATGSAGAGAVPRDAGTLSGRDRRIADARRIAAAERAAARADGEAGPDDRAMFDVPIDYLMTDRGQLHPDRLLVPVSAIRAAQEIDDSSPRRQASGIPVRKNFVRAASKDAPAPPLSQIYSGRGGPRSGPRRGGRGGTVAVKLYLALLWRCSTAPYSTQRPYRAWATLLGLDDPEGNGARRIAAAVKTLQQAGLLRADRSHGAVTTLTLLDESGQTDPDGEPLPYTLPSTQYAKAPDGPYGDAQRAHNTYFKINTRLWTEGHIQSLTGPALIMLLIVLAERGGDGEPVWFSTDAFHDRYRISHDTRTKGTNELAQRGLLLVERQALTDNPGRTSVFERRRYRNLYRLLPPART